MKNLYLKVVVLGLFLPFLFLYSEKMMAQKMSLDELTQLYVWNDTSKIDAFFAPKNWYYMSSEIENGDQVDVWMSEKAQGHIIQAMFVLVSNPLNSAVAHNQATLHLLSAQQFSDLQEQASKANFAFLKEEKKEKSHIEFFRNDKFLLVFTNDRESQLPYKVMIANLKKK